MREFLHVDDMADASVHVMQLPAAAWRTRTDSMLSHINVGTGRDCSIRELAGTIAAVTGFRGAIAFDRSKPDGAPRKLLDVSRLRALGWQASIDLETGLRETYRWFLENQERIRGRGIA